MNIQTAIEICGSQEELARQINVSQSAVSQWVTGVRPVSSRRCLRIEEATNGMVTRYQLRPDVFGEDPKLSKKTA